MRTKIGDWRFYIRPQFAVMGGMGAALLGGGGPFVGVGDKGQEGWSWFMSTHYEGSYVEGVGANVAVDIAGEPHLMNELNFDSMKQWNELIGNNSGLGGMYGIKPPWGAAIYGAAGPAINF